MELIAILLIVLVGVGYAAIKLNANPGMSFPYHKKTSLYTPAERGFLRLLEQSVGDEYRIISRVRLQDIVTIKQGMTKKAAIAALNRTNGRVLDFVLCEKQDLTPVAAIDLVNNKSKDGYKAKKDWFTSGALDAAGLPHIRIKVKAGYRPQEIRACIEAKLAPVNYRNPKPVMKSKNGHKTPMSRPVAA